MPRKKKYIRQPLPPARLGCEPEKRKYIIKQSNPYYNNCYVWYIAASPCYNQNKMHIGENNAFKNNQSGFTNIINGEMIIEIYDPGSYMSVNKIVPPTIFYRVYEWWAGKYGDLIKVEI